MEIHHIRYFLAVFDERNFTRAAGVCNVSQPSLSRAIAQLEAEFGGALFHRERAGAVPTELGQIVEPFIRASMDSAAAAKSAAKGFVRRRKCRIRLGVMCTISPELFTQPLLAMREKHPDIELSVIDGRAEKLRERLFEGKLDAAIYARPEPEDLARAHAIPLFREDMMIVLPNLHRLAENKTVRVNELDGEPYVWRVNCEFGAAVDAIFEAQGVDNRIVFQTDRDDWAQTMVASGAGFGFMPRLCVTHPRVVARPIAEPDIAREVSFVTLRGRQHSRGLGALVREIALINWPAHAGKQAKE